MEKYSIQKITADNRRPGMSPEASHLVRYRLHEAFGWLCCRTFPSLEAAKSFAAALTPEGDLERKNDD